MKKRKWIKWVVLLAIMLVIVGWLTFFSDKTQSAAYHQVQVTQGDLTTYYNFDGVVYAKRQQTIAAAAPDVVKTVYVAQNQQVSKGDKLYKTESGQTVRTDLDGEVTGLYVSEGDVIAAGEKTVQIIDMAHLEVQLNVDEYDVQAIVPGEYADVTVLAIDRSYGATVTALDKNGTASGDLSYYTARLDLQEGENVYPGMQVSAKMLRAQALGASMLKVDAIQFDEYNQPFVYVRAANGEDVESVPVTVGISDGVYCEIVSGVSAGDTVLVPSGMSMAELMQTMRENGPMAR